ncbi:Hypothetical protein A7982_02386 [Minicystis rosea]|nr:Hypothetical protein A7982_02386 [Minicystis rosea]
MQEERIDALLSQVDAAGDDPDEATRARLIGDAIQALAGMNDQSPPILYALAYAWYHHPDHARSAEIQARVTALLTSVLKARPDDFLAWLYLGHNHYDIGELEAASQAFERACAVAPPDYIGLKAYEMALCCAIAMRGLAASLDALARFVEHAERLPSEDVWPRELAQALVTHAAPLSGDERARAIDLATRLDRAGNLGSWIEDILAKLPGA